MKQRIIIVLITFLGLQLNTNQAQADQTNAAVESKVTEQNKSNVQVYYFHATRRCITCNAIEKITKETIEKDFSKEVSFSSINREENKDHELVKKHKIAGQTLLLIKNDKVIDLTNTAFMYARNQPEKFKKELSKALKGLL